MRHFILFFLFLVINLKLNAQQIIEKIWLDERIDACNNYDKLSVKYKKYHKEEVFEAYDSKLKAEQKEIYKSSYDTSGLLIDTKKYYNAESRPYSYTVSFTKINDSTFESLIRYNPKSKDIPLIFKDYEKNSNDSKNIPSFLEDPQGCLIIRSVFRLFDDGRVYEIKRYNIKNELVQIWYPFGQYKPLKKITDTLTDTRGGSTYQNTLYYEDYKVNIRTELFNNNLLLREIINEKYADSSKTIITEDYYYNDEMKCILKIESDEKRNLISMNRYIYKDSALLRREYYETNNGGPIITWNYNIGNGNLRYYENNRDSNRKIVQRYNYEEQNFEIIRYSYVNGVLFSKNKVRYF